MTTPSADCKPTGEFAASGGYTAELEPRSLSTTDAVRSGVGGRLESFKAEGVTVHHCDCMELMRATPDGAFDLAIVDPPYGIGDRIAQGTNPNHLATRGKASLLYKNNPFDHAPPSPEYFVELRRVSRNQIIWGGNYFPLPPHRGFIFWDKVNDLPTMSDGEMAWTSFDKPARKIQIRKAGSEPIIHPTQKPVKLYAWLLATYAKPGQRILDTHLGGGSIAIAARNFGCELVACEIDADYFASSTARIARDFSQQMLFPGGGAEPVGEQLDAFEQSGAQRYNDPALRARSDS